MNKRKYDTRIPLPDEEYTELIGSAIYSFDYNYSFIINNIIESKKSDKNWYELNGRSNKAISVTNELLKVLKNDKNNKIYQSFKDLVLTRNRIVHSFPCTDENDEQILRTLNNKNEQ